MDSTLKTKWVEALRSGEFDQTRECLYDTATKGYCCLGVLCKVAGKEINRLGTGIVGDRSGAEYKQLDQFIPEGHKGRLIKMNDEEKNNFNQIADYIEQNL